MSKASQQIDRYKKKAAMAYAEKQATVRAVVSGAEIMIGAAASGYVAQKVGTVAGVPADAGAAIALVFGGMALDQEDMIALGLGMAAGYARDLGRELGSGDGFVNLSAVG